MTFCVPPMDINFYSTRFRIEWSAVAVALTTTVYRNSFSCKFLYFFVVFSLLPKKGNQREQKKWWQLALCFRCSEPSIAVSLQNSAQQQSLSFIVFVGFLFFWIELYFICLMIIYYLFIKFISSHLRLFFFSFVQLPDGATRSICTAT